MAARLFDAYLFADWSVRSVPGPVQETADSLWVAEGLASDSQRTEPRATYHRTRAECFHHLRQRLLGHAAMGRRVLLGCDFAYGYPDGYAQALGFSGDSLSWYRIWQTLAGLIQDGAQNENNRYESASELNARCGPGPGPLWGCPTGCETGTLKGTRPEFPFASGCGRLLPSLRKTDERAKGVQEVWKLAYAGSVGSQVLLGIPYLLRLREDPELRPISRVWPFETGFTSLPSPGKGPVVLHAEIWPGLVRDRTDAEDPIRDRAQVRAMVRWAVEMDAAGDLARFFDRPEGLSAEQEAAAVAAEGWILGA